MASNCVVEFAKPWLVVDSAIRAAGHNGRGNTRRSSITLAPYEHLTVSNHAQVEALLLERLESTEPGIEATPEFWAKLRDEARARRGAGTGR
jgi:hypothetical protein